MPGKAASVASSLGDGSELDTTIARFLSFCRKQDRLKTGRLPRLKLEEALRSRYRSLLAALSAKEVLSLLWEYSSLSKQLIHHVDYNLFCANLLERLGEKYEAKNAGGGKPRQRTSPSSVSTSSVMSDHNPISPAPPPRKMAWAEGAATPEAAPSSYEPPCETSPSAAAQYIGAPDQYRVEMDDFNRKSAEYRKGVLAGAENHITPKVCSVVPPRELVGAAVRAGTYRQQSADRTPLAGLLGRKSRGFVPPQVGRYDLIGHKWLDPPADPRFLDPEGRVQPWEYDMRAGSKRGHRGRRTKSDRVGVYDPISHEWLAPPGDEQYEDREGIVLESGRVLPSARCGGKGMVGKPDRLMGRYNPLTHEWFTPPREELMRDREYPAATPGPYRKQTNQPFAHKSRRAVAGPPDCPGGVIAWPSPIPKDPEVVGKKTPKGKTARAAPGRKLRI